MATPGIEPNDLMKDEYVDVSNNLRHWNTLRFAELTVFIALTAGLLSALYIGKGGQLYEAGILLKSAGIGSTLVFLVLQERTMAWFHAFLRRSIELERQLGFHQYRDVPRVRVLTSRNAIRLLFLMILVLWVGALLFQPLAGPLR